MSAAKDEMKDYSRRMWIAVFLITAFALSLVAVVIAMALVANSGVGLQVVFGTFILAFTILYASFLLKNKFQITDLLQRPALLRLAGVFMVLSLSALPFSFIIYPTDPLGLWGVILTGGFILSLLLLIVYEGYPRLKERGSPGILKRASQF
jgi:hypothetical protein